MTKTIRIIADVHGHIPEYLHLLNFCDYSIQIGDLDFDYDFLDSVDSTKHKVLSGNHDNIPESKKWPHFLGDYGQYQIAEFECFFVRGGRSIDWKYRTPGIDFFADEELNLQEMKKCFEIYEAAKPSILLSHEGPASLISQIVPWTHYDGKLLQPSATANFLDALLDIHRPRLHIFGHLHKSFNKVVDDTQFICLNELETLDLHLEV